MVVPNRSSEPPVERTTSLVPSEGEIQHTPEAMTRYALHHAEREASHRRRRTALFSAVALAGTVGLSSSVAPTAEQAVATETPASATPQATADPRISRLEALLSRQTGSDMLNPGKAEMARIRWQQAELAKPLDPKNLKNGRQLGAFIIQYDEDARRPWKAIESYYESRNKVRPDMYSTLVHRVVANVYDPSKTIAQNDERFMKNLANGVVVDSQSENANTLLLHYHDITPLKAPIAVNAQLDGERVHGTYDQDLMGVNGLITKHDVAYFVQPLENHPGWIKVKKYKMIGRKAIHVYKNVNGEYVQDNETIVREMYDRPAAADQDAEVIRTSMCWPPGNESQSANQRMVTTFQEVDATIVRGSIEVRGQHQPVMLPHD